MLKNLKELYKYREVLYALSLREIKSRYNQTIIGFIWPVIQPLTLMLILSIVFDKFFKIDNGNIPYPIFLYSALVPWGFFSKTVTNSTTSLITNRTLVTKIYFPKEIIPLSLVIANLMDFISAFLILILMMFYYGTPLSLLTFLVIPIFFIQIIFTISFTLFFSVSTVYFRDIGNAINLIIQAWMYASPIIYSATKIPDKYLSYYMILNPISPLIEANRTIITKGQIFGVKYIFISFVISTLLLMISYSVFKKAEKSFADIL